MLENNSFATLISFHFTLGGEVWLQAEPHRRQRLRAVPCAAMPGGWNQSLYGSCWEGSAFMPRSAPLKASSLSGALIFRRFTRRSSILLTASGHFLRPC